MSRKSLAVFFIAFIVVQLLSGCSAATQQTGPTPFPTAATIEPTLSADPTVLSIAEVAGALGRHEDAPIIVTGRLRRLPLLVCDSDPNPSPATWSLTDNGSVLLAAEFDQQVRLLLPEDVTMTVEGRLRRWNGPVGCGKQAQTQEVWYLETSRIISPSPLTQATLTPDALAMGGGETVPPVTDVPDEAQPTLETSTAEPTVETAVPTDTPEVDIATQQPTATSQNTPLPELTPLPTSIITATATLSATATVTATPGTVTPTATTDPSASPTATAAISAGVVIDKGDVYDVEDDFPADVLGSNEIHSWTVEIFEEDIYDVKVIAPVPADIVLSLYRDGQAVINLQNRAPIGAAEVLEISNQPEGTYEIRIQTASGQGAEYIMFLSIPGDFEGELMGFLASGTPRSNVNLPESMSHYWNFTAAAGNRVTVTLTPSGEADAYFYLYGPRGVFIEEIDDGGEGDAEVFEYTIAESGLHTIVVTDILSEGMTYSIMVTIQP